MDTMFYKQNPKNVALVFRVQDSGIQIQEENGSVLKIHV